MPTRKPSSSSPPARTSAASWTPSCASAAIPGDEIEAALAKLTEQGYLDDRATARVFVESRQGRASEGRSRLRAELIKRGAPDDAVEAALAELTPEDDLAGGPRRRRELAPQGGLDPRALARHLERKGFSRRAIVSVLNGELDGLEIDDGS